MFKNIIIVGESKTIAKKIIVLTKTKTLFKSIRQSF